jgi:TPR repeat protein
MSDPVKHSFHSRGAERRSFVAAAILIALAATPACTRSNASSDKATAAAQTSLALPSQPSKAPQAATLTPELADLQHKAESGNAQAMVQLASAYEKGEGAPRDSEQAITWFTKAADAGDSYAMYRLGRLYATGSGVPKDYVEAFDWYKRASAVGNSDAMYDLGHAYETGSGVREDVQQAVIWYTKAYQHGNQTAKTALVRLGEGFEDHP